MERDITVNGVRLHCVVEGEGPLVLLLHGFPETSHAWRKQMAALATRFRVVAPDLRGYGGSDKPKGIAAYRTSVLADDIVGLIHAFDAERAHVVGHDWGGAVAWAFAIAHPARLERLVIVNAPHPAIFGRLLREDPAQQKASEYMLAFRSATAESRLAENDFAALKRIVLAGLLAAGKITAEDERAYVAAWSQPGALTGGLNYYRAAKIGPPTGAGGEASRMKLNLPSLDVNAPTLVIWGEKDPYLLTGNLNGLDRYVHNLRVERIPDGTHWVVHEKPALVNSLIRRFLES